MSEVEQTQATETVVEETKAPVEDINPLDQAAHIFSTSLPRIKALSSNMSRNALARVFKAVVEFPLSEDYPKFRSQAETELFMLCLATISAKNTMTSAFTQEAKQEIMHESTNGIVQEILQENGIEKKKEDSNVQ